MDHGVKTTTELWDFRAYSRAFFETKLLTFMAKLVTIPADPVCICCEAMTVLWMLNIISLSELRSAIPA